MYVVKILKELKNIGLCNMFHVSYLKWFIAFIFLIKKEHVSSVSVCVNQTGGNNLTVIPFHFY